MEVYSRLGSFENEFAALNHCLGITSGLDTSVLGLTALGFQKAKLKIIEDCAQSHFAEIDGVRSGMFGDIGAFSFCGTSEQL